MADPTQTPIAPVEPSLPSPADLRIEALEAMVRGLGIQMEQMALPQRPSSPRSPLASHDPPPDPLQDTLSPLIPIRNRRFQIFLAVDTYRLRDRSILSVAPFASVQSNLATSTRSDKGLLIVYLLVNLQYEYFRS